jgi:heme exporter protein D
MWRNAFWVAALGVISAYLFFFALGAFSFDEVLPVSLVVIALAALWVLHAYLQHRHGVNERDPRLVHARERRGF